MHRRNFIKSMAAAGATAAIGRRAHAVAKGWREFEIVYRISMKQSRAPVRLWVPVPQDALDYQRVLDLSWRPPVATHVLWEAASRAPMVAATWVEPDTAREIEIIARVATRDRSGFYPDASREVNWVGFNYAGDFTLPGQQDGPISFLMYPYAETAQGVEDSLDPDAFAYTIISNEVA